MESIERNDRMRDQLLDRLAAIESGRFVRDLDFEGSASSIDRKRITEYTGGITRWRRWLDFLIDSWARADSIHPLVRNVLRIGAYELVILDRPDHVVVNVSVEQAKRRMKGRRSASFVNAILRQVVRNIDRLPEPDTGDEAEDLAIRHSHPTWMVRRWLERFGRDDTVKLLEWNNGRPSFGLRINRLDVSPGEVAAKLSDLQVDWSYGRYARDFIVVQNLQAILDAGLLKEGDVAVQDESAGLVVDLFDPQPGEFAVDACAAPGGKLIRSAILMRNEGRIEGIDPNRKRLQMATDAARRHGLSNVSFWTGSFLDWEPPDGRLPDKILLDVPCSGLGVLARRPDLRWRKEAADFEQLNRLQDQLLDQAAEVLRPGGILTYATCTIEPEENEKRIHALLARRPDFDLLPAHDLVPAELITPEGFFSTLPQLHEMDGAFGARLRKSK
jgi:16S rRNA (cytosine967-C5)-methyltransferase